MQFLLNKIRNDKPKWVTLRIQQRERTQLPQPLQLQCKPPFLYGKPLRRLQMSQLVPVQIVTRQMSRWHRLENLGQLLRVAELLQQALHGWGLRWLAYDHWRSY